MRDAQGRPVVRVVRRRRASRRRPPARSSSPTRSSGRSATGRSRTTWSRSGPTSSPSPTRRRSGRRPATSGRCATSDLEDVLRRAHRSADGTYRAIAARAVPGTPLGGFRYYGTRPDDPERRRAARAPARAAGAQGVRRVDEPRRHEGRQHARRAGRPTNGRQRGPPLPAGRRLDVRHRRQRAARVRRGLGVPLRRRPGDEAARHARLLPPAVADGAVRRAPGDRPLRGHGLRSRRLEAARADGGLPARAARRRVLGGAAGDGVLRRDDPRHRQDRAATAIRRPKRSSPTC